MRLLLVDIGNSRVKWALAERNRDDLLAGTPFASRGGELLAGLENQWAGLEPPQAVVAANVAGAETESHLADWVREHWGLPVRWVNSRPEGYGVVNGYAQPERLGVDRWVALVGARYRFALPLCVADCGTALTLDALDGEGRHLGGWIVPGLSLMRHALMAETGGVRVMEMVAAIPVGGLGVTTGEAVSGGAVRACSGLIEKTIADLATRLHVAPGLILTGGDAGSVGRDLAISCHWAPDLVLWGLLVIARNGT